MGYVYNIYSREGKYNNRKAKINNITFDSQKEATRYLELKKLEELGYIKNLKLQPKFLLQEGYRKNGKKIREVNYIADFMYYDCESGEEVIEDVKGIKTDVYKLKKKLFEYKYKEYTIREI